MKPKLGILTLSLIVSLLTSQTPAFGWGNDGHVYVNRVAAQKVPDSMPAFLKTAVDQIGYLGPEPDRWRESSEYTLKEAQEPDHFIDIERLTWLTDLPRGRYEFYRLLYERRAVTKEHGDDLLPERVGLQPYITIEIYERLKVAFRDYRKMKGGRQPTDAVERDIVFYAGWLGHYVADGAQPLHTSINYDGWVENNPNGYTTRHGIHSKFETEFVSRNIASTDFAGLVGSPVKLEDPFKNYLQYLRDSNALVGKVYQIEKAGGFEGKGSIEALEFTNQRLATASQMLLNLWFSAWLESAE